MKLDEFTIGQVFQTKSFKLTKENIMRFAGEFDPQYMHLDEVLISFLIKGDPSSISPIINKPKLVSFYSFVYFRLFYI